MVRLLGWNICEGSRKGGGGVEERDARKGGGDSGEVGGNRDAGGS